MIPKDPVMLLSYVNTQLRDFYSSLDAFCEDKELSGEEVTELVGRISLYKEFPAMMGRN